MCCCSCILLQVLHMTRLGMAVQISAAVFVAGCAGVASAYIALGIKGC
jgi:hypothetical protein